MSLGAYIRKKREAAGLTLGQVARHMGLSIPYLSDVEKGHRRLTPARWPVIAEIIPGLSIRTLAEESLSSGTVTIDASQLTPKQRAILADALVEAASRK